MMASASMKSFRKTNQLVDQTAATSDRIPRKALVTSASVATFEKKSTSTFSRQATLN